jgi:hypothetical protein
MGGNLKWYLKTHCELCLKNSYVCYNKVCKYISKAGVGNLFITAGRTGYSWLSRRQQEKLRTISETVPL